ncbi:SDR family oxidoreductase [Paracoccus xiamenensis]|uniref:SDR family oxidoreductase n=1 Tax=Paracoccus xiamenensis TaxID=2714901 RepID=UPI00140DA18B|nr:SDR family oxidoreductase [Paracoccus xiamenensis]NHF73302.1 SDR family oxidoreductase [Paracoccus xiamenensis]
MRLTGFDGASAFVTGAAGGIGRALVAELVAAGARVMATDTEAALAAMDVGPEGVVWRGLDVRDAARAAELAAEAASLHGPLSLGVHAAGILAVTPVLEMAAEEWQRLIDINAGGTLNMLQSFGQAMRPQRRGAIVVIGSNAGGVPRLGIGAYGASKAAAAMLTRAAGLELATEGIRCNLVAPGSTLTPMQTGMWADPQAGAAEVIAGDAAQFRTGIPLGKLATPQDIAQAAMFLLSDQAGHVTMADLYVDGGATLRA